MAVKHGAVFSDWSSYLTVALFNLDSIIKDAKVKLRDVEFDTFVGTGLSGALVVPSVARAMDKYFAIVRKPNDSDHAETRIEGQVGQSWVFLDDLIASGGTEKRVKEAVETADKPRWNVETRKYDPWILGHHTEYVGSYLYDRKEFKSADVFDNVIDLRPFG